MKLRHLHIPKTGGSAVRWALRNVSAIEVEPIDHSLRLCDLADDEMAITAVRDPVARFCSAYDAEVRRDRGLASRWRWVDDAAREVADLIERYMVWMAPYPLVYWLHDAETVERKCAYLLHTETLDDDWRRLRADLDVPALPKDGHRNRSDDPRSVPKPETVALLHDFYREDYELLEAIA